MLALNCLAFAAPARACGGALVASDVHPLPLRAAPRRDFLLLTKLFTRSHALDPRRAEI